MWDFNRPKGAGGQSGLYWSNRLQNTINPLGGMDLRAIRDYVVLLPSGQAYRDLPKDGHVLDIDFSSACKAKPKNCGTYEIEGGTIRLRWLGSMGCWRRRAERGLRAEREGVRCGRTLYAHYAPVHDLRMNGKYTSTFAMVGNMATQSTSVVSEKYLTLTTDGRYQKSGFSAASFDNSNAAGTFGGRKPVQSGDVFDERLHAYADAGWRCSGALHVGARGSDSECDGSLYRRRCVSLRKMGDKSFKSLYSGERDK